MLNKHRSASVMAGAAILFAIQTSSLPASSAWASKKEHSDSSASSYQQMNDTFLQSQEKYRLLAERFEKTIAEAQTRFKNLKQEKLSLQKDINKTQSAVTHLRLEREKQEQALHKENQMLRDLETRIEKITGVLPTYESAIQSTRKARDLEAQLQTLKTKYADEVREKKAIAKEVLTTVTALQAALDEKTASEMKQKGMAKERHTRMVKAEAELRKETSQRKELQEQVQCLDQKLKEIQHEAALAQKEADKAHASEATLRKALRGNELILASLSDKLKDSETKADKLAKENKNFRRKNTELESDYRDEKRERAALEAIVAQQENELKKTGRELSAAKKEKDTAIADSQNALNLLEHFLLRQEKLMDDLEQVRKNILTPTT